MDYQAAADELLRTCAKNFNLGMFGTIEKLSRFSKGETFIVNYLAYHDGTAIPSELSGEMGSSTARIATVLGNLEKKGLITREINKNNRRQIIVSITDAGRKFSEQQRTETLDYVARILTALGEEDTRTLLRIVERFSEASATVLDSAPTAYTNPNASN